jgi:hypothetical protein
MAQKFTSLWLLEQKGKATDDVCFFTGAVKQKGKELIVDLTDCPVMVNSDKDAANIKATYGVDLPVKAAIRTASYEGLSAISGGAFLWVKEENQPDRLAVLERNGGAANAGSGLWTDPNGLCAEAPQVTIPKELAEENPVLLLMENGKTIIVPILHDGRQDYCLPDAAKKKQTKNIVEYLENKYKAELPEGLDIEAALEFAHVPIEERTLPEGQAKTVVFVNEGVQVDEKKKNVLVFHEPEYNTWAFRSVYEMEIPKGMTPLLVDPEGFGRNAALMTAAELKNKPMLSSLKAYVDTLNPL